MKKEKDDKSIEGGKVEIKRVGQNEREELLVNKKDPWNPSGV